MEALLSGLSPEVQIALIICAFALATVAIMAIFLVVSSRKRTHNLSTVIRDFTENRKNVLQEAAPSREQVMNVQEEE